MTQEELHQAGFVRADWIPSGTRYQHGELYVRLTEQGSLRLFIPAGQPHAVELASGSLYEPVVHFLGPLEEVAAQLGRLE
ncbi:hypothetical protein [Hymenobacter sp. B81]|uniref:hypothetical protein n=1 Tax=Hymenobacter sp. B81 TaxID=3344878 RepID=UPI0037DC244D